MRRCLGIPATIVMPVTTPFVKVAATKAHGARVLLDGETISEAQARAEAEARGARADLGASLRRSACHRGAGHHRARNAGGGARDLDVLVIPIGGGGLVSGIAIAAKAIKPGDRDRRRGIRRSIPSMWNAIRGEQRPLGGATLAEGIAVKNVGSLTLPIIRALVSDILLVDEEHIERAVNAYPHLAESDGGGRRRGRARRHAGAARSASPAARSGSCCAAATSIRASSPRSWCASSSATTGSSRSA